MSTQEPWGGSTDDEPVLTISQVIDWVWNLLAAIGMMALAALIGLYYSGFFHYFFGK